MKRLNRWSKVLLLCALVFAFCGCQKEAALEEPRGENIPLLIEDFCLDLPESYQEYAAWETKGDGFLYAQDNQKALFCYRQAQATFPREKPKFEAGSELNTREWSGQPVRTYLSKAEVFVNLQQWALAEHYLALAEGSFEHPSDLAIFAEIKGKYHFAQGQYQAAADALEEQPTFFCRILHAAARHELKDADAALDLHYLARELRDRTEVAVRLMADRLPERASKLFLDCAEKPRADFS